MALLQSLLATVLSPTQEENIAYNAVHVLSILRSSNGLIDSSDDKTAHKFKVRVSALLKSKSPLLRWFGSHLVKASVESNWTVLKSHGQTWADSLLYILEIPGPTVTHQSAIQSLSILFARVHGKATLTKEITTPRIPAYLKLLVSLSKGNSALWPTTLPAITRVIRLQTSTFRSQAEHVRQLMIDIIEKTYMESSMVDRSTLQNACEAFICLHMVATKGKEADEWRITFIRTINEIHITLNQLCKDFINEDNEVVIEPSQGLKFKVPEPEGLLRIMDKLETLLVLLTAFFTSSTKIQVRLPYGQFQRLADRLYSIPHAPLKQIREKSEIQLYNCCIEKIITIYTEIVLISLPVVGKGVVAHFDNLMLYIHYFVTNKQSTQMLKMRLTELASKLFKLVCIVPQRYSKSITAIIHVCLEMMQPETIKSDLTKELPDSISSPQAFIELPQAVIVAIVTEFLVTIIETLPSITVTTRSQIDRFFLINRVAEGMRKSSLHPGNTKYSIAPMTLRLDSSDSPLIQSIVHPRLPPLGKHTQNLEKTAPLGSFEGQSSAEDNEMDIDENYEYIIDYSAPSVKELNSTVSEMTATKSVEVVAVSSTEITATNSATNFIRPTNGMQKTINGSSVSKLDSTVNSTSSSWGSVGEKAKLEESKPLDLQSQQFQVEYKFGRVPEQSKQEAGNDDGVSDMDSDFEIPDIVVDDDDDDNYE